MTIQTEADFEEQWRKLMSKARAAKATYEDAVDEDRGSKQAAKEMYAANSEVRRFCEAEQEMKLLAAKMAGQQTPGA